ncbi:hypothetical protein J4G08_21750 [Candidatus Poribacteria bacterium]|nr:hypothetical protein [Candidatus Poribacteria bacterium]
MSLNKQEKLLTIARKKYDDFREVSQDMQCHVLKRNDKAFANFRRRCENGASKKGYLRYKKRVRSLTWSLRKYPKVVHRKTKDAAKQTIEEEFTSDVLEIMTVFCAKLYGRRSHKSKKMAQEIEKIVSEEKQQLELHFGTPHTENSPESE